MFLSQMKFLSLLLFHFSNFTHYIPSYCVPNWELTESTKYDRHADMCLIMELSEGNYGKERIFSRKKNASKSTFSMELDCM